MSSAAIPLAQMGFRKISELAGVAGAREPCSEIRGRGKCLGLGCTYDTSRGCKVRTGGSSAILDLSGAKMDMGSQPKASAETTSRRAGAKGGKEEGGRAAAGAAKREEGGGALSCETSEMQRRSNCKANPLCVYDTALGCYTKK